MFEALVPFLSALIPSIGSALVQNAGSKARVDQMNAYNAPAAQMQRYAAAGLNPNLIYGQGTPGNQTSAAQFVSPDIDPVKIWSAAQAVKESRMRTELHSARKSAQAMAQQYLIAKYNADEPYFARNARYQSQMLEQRFKNEAARTTSEHLRQNLMERDREIRESMLRERGYYERQRNVYGLQPNDNPFTYGTRAAVSLLGDMGRILHFNSKNK